MYRLLIADDEMIERAVLYKTLHKNLGDQCAIFQAENGREALRIYEQEKIQIAILDIEMPGINGIEAAERIREKDKDCCIIFLTAFDEFSYAKKAIMIRALDYLLKPYDEQELMLVVEEAMRLTNERQKEKIIREQQLEALGEGRADSGTAVRPQIEASGEETEEEEGELEEDGNIRLSKVGEIISQYIHENYLSLIHISEPTRRS